MKKSIWMWLLVFVTIVLSWSVFREFMLNHTYYNSMFASSANWYLIIRGLVGVAIPLIYAMYIKRFDIFRFLILLLMGLWVYALAFVSIKDNFPSSMGFVMLLINVLIIFALGIYSFVAWLAIGSWLMNKIMKKTVDRWQDMLLAFGLGLSAFIVIVHFLIIFGIFYSIFTWLLFVLGGLMMWLQKDGDLKRCRSIVEEMFVVFNIDYLKKNKYAWFGLGLLVVSVLYYYYGFMLSFIPYSTAWDANHAYMYIPKVWAENAGALGYGHPGGAGGHLWLSYIAVFFSLIEPIKSWFWLSPDNIAVSMNYLSAILVLFLGLGLMKEFVGYISSIFPEKTRGVMEVLGFYVGRSGLLLWLTSGMGAFLVFVDNKTDMGVLAMTVLAMLSGLIFIRYIHEHHKKNDQSMITNYIIIAGLFFGLAVVAKPTAFIDVVVFALFLLALWLNNWLSLSIGFLVLAILARMQVLFTREFLSVNSFWPLLGIAVVLMLIGLRFAYKNIKNFKDVVSHTFRTFVLWGFTFLVVLLVIKGPYLMIGAMQSGNFSVGSFAKGLIMGYKEDGQNERVLFASVDGDLELQNNIDSQINVGLEMCDMDMMGWTQEDLNKNLRDFEGGDGLSEDVGRYVGFGWREFNRGLFYNIVGLFLADGTCLAWDSGALVLCNNEQAVDNFDINVLSNLYANIDQNSHAYQLLDRAFNDEKFISMMDEGNFNPGEMRQHIVDMRQWYQSRSIKNKGNSLMVPYRYIVPWNATFNRSLQNLSSYYTDIGFIWGIFIFLMIIALFYAWYRRNQKVIAILTVSLFGWLIRWVIAGGIVRYGIGLIVWTVMALIGFMILLLDDVNDDDRSYFAFYVFVFVLFFFFVIQILMNFIRMSSQGGGGPFVWYKTSVGNIQVIGDNLSQTQELKIPYKWDSVFNLQFGHYNKFIDHVRNRPDEDGVSIAGTYLQYFLHNQKNVGSANIYRLTSDGNTCKSYLRFRNDDWRYVVIDPNILSVVMGEGNESLMHRFFARRNPVSGRIEEDGEITMLVKMWYDGYLSLFHSNNLGAKYAFELDDEVLKNTFGLETYDELVYLRAKLSVARFFPDASQLINFIANIFVQRLAEGKAIGDLADVFGRTINEEKVFNVIQGLVGGENPNNMRELISELDQDERFIVLQYVSLFNMMRQNQQQFQSTLQNIISQSVAGGSQLIVFELKE